MTRTWKFSFRSGMTPAIVGVVRVTLPLVSFVVLSAALPFFGLNFSAAYGKPLLDPATVIEVLSGNDERTAARLLSVVEGQRRSKATEALVAPLSQLVVNQYPHPLIPWRTRIVGWLVAESPEQSAALIYKVLSQEQSLQESEAVADLLLSVPAMTDPEWQAFLTLLDSQLIGPARASLKAYLCLRLSEWTKSERATPHQRRLWKKWLEERLSRWWGSQVSGIIQALRQIVPEPHVVSLALSLLKQGQCDRAALLDALREQGLSSPELLVFLTKELKADSSDETYVATVARFLIAHSHAESAAFETLRAIATDTERDLDERRPAVEALIEVNDRSASGLAVYRALVQEDAFDEGVMLRLRAPLGEDIIELSPTGSERCLIPFVNSAWGRR